MSVVKVMGIIVALVSGAIHLATYRPRVLRISILILLAAPALLMLPLLSGIAGSLVNPMAAVWGAHTTWKMVLAGALYVLYPAFVLWIAWLATRAILKQTSLFAGPADIGKIADPRSVRRVSIAGLIALAGIPLLYFIANSIFILVESLAIPPMTPADLIRLSQEPGYGWVLFHPSPAIHHAYAATTFFYTSAVAALLFACSAPISRWLIRLLGRPSLVRAISGTVSIVSVILAILA
ncbi:hypothetical protein KAX17_12705 [Candidatus Bipolaricaulota bacterium]|nr:hypothetical protein [Candidatus Bipolaricaulota bacterium]